MIVLDASVLIAHLQPTDPHHDRAVELLLAVAREQLAASPITLAEVLLGPARTGQVEQARAVLRRLDVTPIAWAEDGPERVAVLRGQTGLRIPDCCVLLAASQRSALLATFDRRLADAAGQLGLEVVG